MSGFGGQQQQNQNPFAVSCTQVCVDTHSPCVSRLLSFYLISELTAVVYTATVCLVTLLCALNREVEGVHFHNPLILIECLKIDSLSFLPAVHASSVGHHQPLPLSDTTMVLF